MKFHSALVCMNLPSLLAMCAAGVCALALSATAQAQPPPRHAARLASAARAARPALEAESIPAPAARSGAPGLTLADLEGMAMANQPTLALAAARVNAARGRWVQAGLLPNPTAGYMGTQMGDESTAGQQGGFVSQELITGGKLRLSRAAAAAEIRALERELVAQRLRVRTDVRLEFYEVLAAARALEIAEELSGIGKRGLDTAESLFGAQEVSRIDVLQARIERNTAVVARQSAHNRYLAAWRRLAANVGIAQLEPVGLAGSLESDDQPIVWEEALARITAASPELAAANARLSRARWMLERARAQPVPNVQAMASVQHDNATHDDIANAQLGLELPIFNRNQGGIREAQAEIVAARAETGRVFLGLQQRLAQEFRQYDNARQQAEAYRRQILPDAEASLKLVMGGYPQELPYLSVLTAQRTLSQVNMAYLEALLMLRRSEAVIDGLLLTGSLAERR